MSILRNSVLVLALVFAATLGASAADQPVEVSGSVDFKSDVGNLKWNAIYIDLRANKNPKPDAPNPQYVDDIEVTLTVGYDHGSSKFSFYQASMTLISLKQGEKKRIAFFIPREIVERDTLPREPDFWTIDIAIEGQELPMVKDRASSSVADAARLSSFKNAYSSKISETEGILMPAHLSPYGFGSGERREPPAVIWNPKDN